jgi:hypothetical protein
MLNKVNSCNCPLLNSLVIWKSVSPSVAIIKPSNFICTVNVHVEIIIKRVIDQIIILKVTLFSDEHLIYILMNVDIELFLLNGWKRKKKKRKEYDIST